MTIHVGVGPYDGKISCYNEKTNETNNYRIQSVRPYESDKINSMFMEIISKINGTHGCICFSCDISYENNIRKKIIKEGIKCGFRNVQIIHPIIANYLNAMAQTTCMPLNGDVIWIYLNHFFQIWQINNQKSRYVGSWKAVDINLYEIENIIKESNLNKGPDFVFNDSDNITRIKMVFTSCKIFSYETANFQSNGSLVKAKIAASNQKSPYCDPLNMLFTEKFFLRMGKKEIASFHYLQKLPIKYCQKLARDSDELEIVTTVYGHHGAFKLPNWEEMYLTLKIDTNQIYSVKFDRQQSFNKIDVTNDVNTTKIYKIPKISVPFDASIYAVGIDLGTSRCCVAVNRKNGIITVPLDNTGERLLPSYVAFDEEMPKCGMIVVERLRNFSKSTVFDSNRIIGRNIDKLKLILFGLLIFYPKMEKLFWEFINLMEKEVLVPKKSLELS